MQKLKQKWNKKRFKTTATGKVVMFPVVRGITYLKDRKNEKIGQRTYNHV